MDKKPNFIFYDFIKPAFADKTQNVVIPAWRRSWKTFGGFQWILLELMRNPWKKGIWVDTIQANLSKYIDRYVRDIMWDFWDTLHIDNQKYIITFMNGSILDMVSAERPENMEWFGYDFYVLNEAGIILKNPKLWDNTIAPMVKNAQGKIIGTPKGKTANGEEHKYFSLSLLEQTETNWKTYHYTAYDSPEYTEEELEQIKRTSAPYIWLQEYMAEFVDIYEGSLIQEQDLRYYDHALLDDFDSVYIHADTTHTGKTTSDYFACGVMWESKKDKCFYLLDFILEKMDVEQQARSAISLYSKYRDKVQKMTYDEKSNQWFWFWIKKLARDEYNLSLPIEELKYPNDKVTHFEPHIPHFKANRVYIPRNHIRTKTLTDQILAFPTKWVNDDAVDMISGCLDNFNNGIEIFV